MFFEQHHALLFISNQIDKANSLGAQAYAYSRQAYFQCFIGTHARHMCKLYKNMNRGSKGMSYLSGKCCEKKTS
jgi:hypothetical protein